MQRILESSYIQYFTILKLFTLIGFVIILCNLNGVLFLILGIKAPLSPILLLISIVVILLSLINYRLKFDSNTIYIYTWFLVSYIFIGFCMYLYTLESELYHSTSIVNILRQLLSTFLIVYFAYFASKVYIRAGKSKLLLNTVFNTILFTNIFTAITPFIGLTTIYSHAKNYLLDGERTGGFFANANEAGVFGNYLIVIYFIMFLKKEKRKWVLLPVLFLGLYNSFISFSKAAMLVAPIIIIYFIIFSFFKLNHLKRHNQKSIISVVFIFIILVFAIATNFDSIHGSLDLSKQRRIDNILLLASGQIDKKTTSKRSVLFEHGIRKISQKPLLGYGLGSFQQFNRGPIQLGVHNTFLLIAGESGIIPISLFILFLGTLFYKGYFFKEPEIGFFITAVIIVFIINLYGTNHSTIPDRPSNILIGAFLALLEKKK